MPRTASPAPPVRAERGPAGTGGSVMDKDQGESLFHSRLALYLTSRSCRPGERCSPAIYARHFLDGHASHGAELAAWVTDRKQGVSGHIIG